LQGTAEGGLTLALDHEIETNDQQRRMLAVLERIATALEAGTVTKGDKPRCQDSSSSPR
jgi:hypothetical protein